MDISNLLQGGTILMVLGIIFAYMKNIPRVIFNFIERKFIVKIVIYDEDESFTWVKIWLASKLEGTRSMMVYTRKEFLENNYNDEQSSDKAKSKIFYTPAPGFYPFRFKNKFAFAYRSREESNGSVASQLNSSSKPKESFVIKIFTRDVSIGKAMVEEARNHAIPDDNKIEVRCGIANYNPYWKMLCRIHKRKISSVILSEGIMDKTIEDLKHFFDSRKWYEDMGIPYKRGYLFYGPPGTGKTSLAIALAGEFKMNISILSLSGNQMDDTKLVELLSTVNDNEIILIEDIDCAFSERENKSKEDKLTFSGLLNALDGVVSQDSRIVIMTTNHPEKLDPALIRPGRVDYKLNIGLADSYQANELFLRFFPGREDLSELFAEAANGKFGMAELQNELVTNKDCAEKAYESVLRKS